MKTSLTTQRYSRGEKTRGNGKRRYAMGDKGGKKDKEKGQKQKAEKQKQKSKINLDKQPKRKA
jgi:hypothetical protein